MTTIDNPIRNGVDTATLFATLDAVKSNNELAKFQFRVTNRCSPRPKRWPATRQSGIA